MATSDVMIQRVLYYCMVPVILEILIYIFLKKYGTSIKERYINIVTISSLNMNDKANYKQQVDKCLLEQNNGQISYSSSGYKENPF